MRIVFVKVGGGLLAPKDKKFELNRQVFKEFARQFKQVRQAFPETSFVLGNGGGSFGHLPAVEYNFKGKIEREKLFAAGFIHRKVVELNTYLATYLQEEGVFCFQFSPASFISASKGEIVKVNSEPVFSVLKLGVIPLVFGDVVPDEAYNFSIVSTEKIFKALVLKGLEMGVTVERVVHIGNYQGVLSASGRVIEEIRASQLERVRKELSGVEGKDITGGMVHKVEEAVFLARRGIEVNIVGFSYNGNNLLRVLKGERVGTRVLP